MSEKKVYNIYFCIERYNKDMNKKTLESSEVKIEEEFFFYDYDFNMTIKDLKEYFLSNFGYKYQFCSCILFLFNRNTYIFQNDQYSLINESETKKLNELNLNDLFLIKRNTLCNCDLKMYNNYFVKSKFDLINKIKELVESNDKLNKKIDQLKKTDELVFKEAENFYDIIIDIQSISEITRGWDIKINEEGKKKYEKYKNEEIMRIGVVGNKNKGKSFLLSKISKIPLLSGSSITTLGLSIKYPKINENENKHFVLLDSAGLETPVLKNEYLNSNKSIINEEKDDTNDEEKEEKNNDNLNQENLNNSQNNQNLEEEKNETKEGKTSVKDNLKEIEKNQNKEFRLRARDKNMTELFLQNFVIENSDILLLVVGNLTYTEQLLINKIKHEIKESKKDKFFIVHNLQYFTTINQVEEYIKDTLLKCSTFNLKKNRLVNVNDDENKEKETIDEDKKKTNKNEIKQREINENTIGKGVHFYEITYNDKKKIDIYHLILANEDSEAGKVYNVYTYKFIEGLFNTITKLETFDLIENIKDEFVSFAPRILKNEINKSLFNKNEDILKNKIIKLNLEKEKLILKKCQMDELGFSFFKTGDFEPKYNYYKPDEKTLEIRLEVPGNTTVNVNWTIEQDVTKIKIKGSKKKDKTPKNLEDNIFNVREFSDFEVDIPLKNDEFQIKSKDPKKGYPKIVSGICIIQYELGENEGENASTQNNEEV